MARKLHTDDAHWNKQQLMGNHRSCYNKGQRCFGGSLIGIGYCCGSEKEGYRDVHWQSLWLSEPLLGATSFCWLAGDINKARRALWS